MKNLPKNIHLGNMTTGHIQGIAIDRERRYMYYSFTTSFVKTDLDGNVIGSVDRIAGHIGCIAYNSEDGRVYASLEFKHDSIGQGVLKIINKDSEEKIDVEDGFYIVVFDVEKIDRVGMNAEKDGVMSAVYLPEVFNDFSAEGHRYGCSGIDGLTFAPSPASTDGKKFLYVSYGIYQNTVKGLNDRQVILCYDHREFTKYAATICQSNMHKRGPSTPKAKYFVYTGNTTWGVQNLEYDEESALMFLAVYNGIKPEFPNYPMFMINMTEPAFEKDGEMHLSLAKVGTLDEKTGIYGSTFPYGSTGMISLGERYFYFSRPDFTENKWSTDIGLYLHNGDGSFSEVK